MTHWRIGLKWFSDCLIDWDPASNTMGWQWSAGSDPDATPYFRVFNPVTQLQKFDPKGIYTKRWIELSDTPSDTSLSYFDAMPKHWKFDKESVYPSAIMSPEEKFEKRNWKYIRIEFLNMSDLTSTNNQQNLPRYFGRVFDLVGA